jgi:predicted NUDIX family NTP pyrophosphohydrolase
MLLLFIFKPLIFNDMPKKSAGILLFRFRNRKPEFLLVHPGGPFWVRKDLHAWSVPKGEFEDNENPLAAAIREFEEETGTRLSGNFIELAPVRQKSGKTVYCYAIEGDLDTEKIRSNYFEIEWPARSGLKKSFPEIDRGEWFDPETAKVKIIESQVPFIDEIQSKIAGE